MERLLIVLQSGELPHNRFYPAQWVYRAEIQNPGVKHGLSKNVLSCWISHSQSLLRPCGRPALHSGARRWHRYSSFILKQLLAPPVYRVCHGDLVFSGNLMCFGNLARNMRTLGKKNLKKRKVEQQALSPSNSKCL